MSIKIMTEVWEKSRYGGERLLLLLAVADAANEANGCVAWPSVAFLGKKTRVSGRYIKKLVKEMCAAEKPEIEVVKQGGGRSANHYHIILENLGSTPEQVYTPEHTFTPEHLYTPPLNTCTPHPCTPVHPNRNSKRKETVIPVELNSTETPAEIPVLEAPKKLTDNPLDKYPADVRPFVARVALLLGVEPPRKAGKNGGQYAYWIKGARELIEACGDVGPDALDVVHDQVQSEARRGKVPVMMLTSPNSFVQMARVAAGQLRVSMPVKTRVDADGGFYG